MSREAFETIDSKQSATKIAWAGSPPIATIGVLAITAVFTGLQFINPAVLSALRRDPAALAAGEWWRMFTPLLVHANGWVQIVVNFAGIAIVGPAVERMFGHWRWLALYLGAGLVAEAISYAWEPFGAGASIALVGLIGGLATWLLWRKGAAKPIVLIYAVCLVADLLGLALAGYVAGALAAALVGNLLGWLLRREIGQTVIINFVAAVIFGGALELIALRDNHGPPILVGAGLAAIMLWLERRLASSAPNVRAE